MITANSGFSLRSSCVPYLLGLLEQIVRSEVAVQVPVEKVVVKEVPVEVMVTKERLVEVQVPVERQVDNLPLWFVENTGQNIPCQRLARTESPDQAKISD